MPTPKQVKWTPCYCGGYLKEVFQSEKVTDSIRTRHYTYKEDRWQLVNCFPKEIMMEQNPGKTIDEILGE